MGDILRKLILQKCPNYDFDRYSFKEGDYIETLDGAKIIVEYSALDYVSAFVIKRSLKYRQQGRQRVYYSDLPYYKDGEFESKLPKITKSIKWKVGDIVHTEDTNMTVLLTEEIEHQRFYGFVLQSEQGYYLHTNIYIPNPYKDYIEVKA